MFDDPLVDDSALPLNQKKLLQAAASPCSVRELSEAVGMHLRSVYRLVNQLVDNKLMKAIPIDGKLMHYQSLVSPALDAGPYKVRAVNRTLDDMIKVLANPNDDVNSLGRILAGLLAVRHYNSWAHWNGEFEVPRGSLEARPYLEMTITNLTRLLAALRELYHFPDLWNNTKALELFEADAPTEKVTPEDTYKDLAMEWEAACKRWKGAE